MMVPRHGTDLGALPGIAANYAGMVELADTYGLGPYASRMRVQVSLPVPLGRRASRPKTLAAKGVR